MKRPLRLLDSGVRAAMRHPALEGTSRIARGHFCAVFSKPGDTVLKLTTDALQYMYYRDGLRPEGPYFPKLVTDHGEVGTTTWYEHELPIFLVEMERLRPASEDRTAQRASLLLRQVVYAAPSGYEWDALPRNRTMGKLQNASQNEQLPKDMREALSDMAMFAAHCDEHLSLDLHCKNVMRRGEQIVLNDPFADYRYTS